MNGLDELLDSENSESANYMDWLIVTLDTAFLCSTGTRFLFDSII